MQSKSSTNKSPVSKQDIEVSLTKQYADFLDWLDQCSPEAFENGPEGKWTAGQHFDHIVRSTKPLNQALRLPKIAIQLTFGKCNRETLNYEGVVAKYNSKLSGGGAASGRYVPPAISAKQKAALKKTLLKERDRLIQVMDKWSDKQMDTQVLPHPLLGKLTVREMMYFTIFHTEKHTEILKESYKQ